MRHELRKWFKEKVRRATEQRQGGDGCHNRQGNRYHCHNYKWQDCDDSGHCSNYDKRKKKPENKTPPDRGDKAFKPCSTHGPKSKHTSKECYKNPKNQHKCQTHNKNHQYKVHHNDAHYTSDDNELRISTNTLIPSEDLAPASSKSKTHVDENYHPHVGKKLKAGSHVPCKSNHQQHRGKFQSSKRGETPPTFLDDLESRGIMA